MTPNLIYYYRGLGRLWPMRDITLWIAAHVLGITPGPEELREGGEPLVFWVQAFWVFAAAVIATAIWSLVDRRRQHYATLHNWFRLFVRFALAASMFEYGMTKVIPTQFPAPSLTTLVTPTGQLTLSALLWTAIGASPTYEIFTGCVELLGGILLLTPRTTLLGALICLAATTQVFVLNMTYDIGVKLVSLHLMLLALFLLAPDVKRLADVFVWNRPTSASPEPALMRTRRGNRIALAAQVAFGIYLLAMFAHINLRFWDVGGGGRPRSALYGVWEVEQLSVDGELRPAELNEYDRRWRRVIFDTPDMVIFQRPDDSFARYGASIDENRRTLALRKGESRTWKASLSYQRPSPDRLIVEGDMDGHRILLQLRHVDFDTFRLLNSTFRWVRPHDP
ncbi:MAG TPA: hypothetical protein VFV95_12045 [Vicinamibacterales bacterium]|nr:hypothetical protein [Vicinamibacterales bacterium]